MPSLYVYSVKTLMVVLLYLFLSVVMLLVGTRWSYILLVLVQWGGSWSVGRVDLEYGWVASEVQLVGEIYSVGRGVQEM